MMTLGEHNHDGSMNSNKQRYFEGEHNLKGNMSNNSMMTPSKHDYERSNNNSGGIRQP